MAMMSELHIVCTEHGIPLDAPDALLQAAAAYERELLAGAWGPEYMRGAA